jgi:hypothetical protein
MQRTIFVFLFYLFSILCSTVYPLQLQETEQGILKAKKQIVLEQLIPFLDFKSKVNCGKTCKALYEIVKPKNIILSLDDSKGLNIYDYTHAMIYYARNRDYSSIQFLLHNTNKTNREETERFYKFISGHSYYFQNEYEKREALAKYYGIYISEYDTHNLALQSVEHGCITLFLLCCKHNKKSIKTVNNSQDGNTLLHLVKPKTELCDYLISRIDVNIENTLGEAPLHYSIKNPGRTQLPPPYANLQLAGATVYNCHKVEYLLNNPKIDVNKQNKEGETPLHYAIKHFDDGYGSSFFKTRFLIIQLLLKHPDIKINIPNNKNETALDYAHKLTQNKNEIIDLLISHKALPQSFFQNHKVMINVCSFLALLSTGVLVFLLNTE